MNPQTAPHQAIEFTRIRIKGVSLVRSQIAESYVVVGGTLDASRASHADAVTVEQQACQQQRVIRGQPAPVSSFVLRHKEQTNPTRPSRRPQTAPGDLPATNLADKEPAETADLDRKLENVCSPSHHIQLLVSVKYFARIYLRQALRLSPFPRLIMDIPGFADFISRVFRRRHLA
jgi:hypothetical protein